MQLHRRILQFSFYWEVRVIGFGFYLRQNEALRPLSLYLGKKGAEEAVGGWLRAGWLMRDSIEGLEASRT